MVVSLLTVKLVALDKLYGIVKLLKLEPLQPLIAPLLFGPQIPAAPPTSENIVTFTGKVPF